MLASGVTAEYRRGPAQALLKKCWVFHKIEISPVGMSRNVIMLRNCFIPAFFK